MTEEQLLRCLTVGKNVLPAYPSSDDYDKLWKLAKKIRQPPVPFDSLTDLQRRVDRNLINNGDTVIIAPGESTSSRESRMLAYLLPVLRSVGSASRIEDRGPEVLIISKSRSTAFDTDDLAQRLSSKCNIGSSQPRITYTGQLPQQCINTPRKSPLNSDILTMSVDTFRWILNVFTNGELFKRVRYLVWDETDCYSEQDWEWLLQGINVCSKWSSRFHRKGFRLVLVSSEWSHRLETLWTGLLKDRQFMGVYFSSLIEFGKLVAPRWRVKFVEKSERDSAKTVAMLDICQQVERREGRIGVAVASDLYGEMVARAINVTYEGVPTFNAVIYEPGAMLKPGNAVILRDSFLTVRNKIATGRLEVLVSFDGERLKQLRYLEDCAPRFEEVDGRHILKRSPVEVIFLLDGEEPGFVDFYKAMKELGAEIDSELEETGRKLLEKYNADGLARKLCSGARLFGYCNEVSSGSCLKRHEICVEDVTIEHVLPCLGEIEFEVLACTNPSYYSALLLSYSRKDQKGKTVKLRDFTEEIQQYKNSVTNHWQQLNLGIATHPNTYKTYIAKEPGKANRSAKFVPVKLRSRKIQNTCPVLQYEVQSLETGEVYVVPDQCLWEPPPPDSFGEVPSTLIFVVYANVCPPKRDRYYSINELQAAKELTEGKTFTGQISLSLGDAIWLTSIRNESGDELKPDLKVGANPEHADRLISQVQAFGAAYSGHHLLSTRNTCQVATSEKFQSSQDTVQWRHLPLESPVKVKARWVESPWLFYGECLEFKDLLAKLERELHSWAESNLFPELNVNETMFFEQLQLKDMVAVKYDLVPGRSWARGRVIEKKGDVQTGFMFTIFLVDYGETMFEIMQTDVKPISKELVARLPFQAVAMSLSHLQPCLEGAEDIWSDQACNVFQDELIRNEIGETFSVVAWSELKGYEYILPKYYEVVAMTPSKTSVGEILIEKNMANLSSSGDISPFLTILRDSIRPKGDSGISSGISSSEQDEDPPSVEQPADGFQLNPDDFEFGVPSTSPPIPCKAPKKKKKQKETQPEVISSFPPTMFIHPAVFWRETHAKIIFSVELPDISVHKLELDDNRRTLRCTIQEPPDYGFQLTLYGKINRPESYLTGQRLIITCQKVLPSRWPRLLSDKSKFPWLKPNLEHISDESSAEEDSHPPFEPPLHSDTEQGFETYSSSDEEALPNPKLRVSKMKELDEDPTFL